MAYVTNNFENVGLLKNEVEQYKQNENGQSMTDMSKTSIYQTPPPCSIVGSSGSMNLPVQLVAIPAGKELKKHMSNENMHSIEVEMEEGLYGGQRDQERKVRREIANSNERRRMQSINAGFKTLKTILPHSEGDKLSKATILQNTAEYIFQLESEKLKFLQQNERLKQAIYQCKCGNAIQKAALIEATEKDEGIGSPGDEDVEEAQNIAIRKQLDKERALRRRLEERVREMEAQLSPEKYSTDNFTPLKKQQQEQPIKKEDVKNYIVSLEKNTTVYNQQKQQPFSNSITVQSKAHPLHNAVINPTPHLHHIQPPHVNQAEIQYVSSNNNSTTYTDHIPQPALCITISGNEVVKSPTQTKKPTYNNQPRSKQPLKKRVIDMTEQNSFLPANKMAKLNVNETIHNTAKIGNLVVAQPTTIPAISTVPLIPNFSNSSLPQTLILPKTMEYQNLNNVSVVSNEAVSVIQEVLQKNNTSSYEFQAKVMQDLQPKNNVSIPQTSTMMPASEQTIVAKPQNTNSIIVSPHSNSLQGSFLSMSPVVLTQNQSLLWKDQQRFSTPLQHAQQQRQQQNYQVAVTAATNENIQNVASRFILQPTTQRVQPNAEEMTLNQINSAPSLSMTLTQLNALPTVSRSTGVVVPLRNVQPQYLPLVTMDSVLRSNMRRLSNATTDSSPSDEDNRTEATEEPPAQKEAIVEQKVSSPKEIKMAPSSAVDGTSVSCTTTVSVLSSGPGSPPVIRHIDKVATRRNLETIVQAIDHLEQQERRNSQDQQSCGEDENQLIKISLG